jgi:hypothetical protein
MIWGCGWTCQGATQQNPRFFVDEGRREGVGRCSGISAEMPEKRQGMKKSHQTL